MVGRFVAVLILVGISSVLILGTAAAGDTTKYANCKALNARYRHGVGKVGARDRTKSGDPVMNFKRSNTLYRQNVRLDRDKDGVACEKK